MAKGQLTQVQDSDRKWSVLHAIMWLASSTLASCRGRGAYKGGKILVQELDSQRGEGPIFKGSFFSEGYNTCVCNFFLQIWFRYVQPECYWSP